MYCLKDGKVEPLDKITIGFRAFDPHELLIYFLAVNLGHYKQNGLTPELKDVALTTDDDELYHSVEYLVACGSALMGALKGIHWKIVFVATENPMFWVYGNQEISSLQELRGKKIAGYPLNTPPGRFLRIILRKNGIDPDRDLTIESVHDDLSRLGLLRSGQADHAVLSSAMPPPKIQKLGLKMNLFFGEHLKIPSAGLAVREELVQENPDQVRGVIRAHNLALNAVSEFPTRAMRVIANLSNNPSDLASETYDLVFPLLTTDGKSSEKVNSEAIRLLSQELSLNPRKSNDIYDFSLL